MTKKHPKTNILLALEKLGLSENEAELYMIMVKHPKVTVQDLLNYSPFPRTLIYYLLRNLIRHGLVSSLEQKRRTIYVVKDPENLYDLLRTKEQEFDQNKRTIKQLIPELKNQFRLSQSRPGFRLFEGVRGYRTALEDMLDSGVETIYSYLDIGKDKRPGVEIRKDIKKKRLKAGISEKILLMDNNEGKIWARKNSTSQMTQCKVLPKKLNPFQVEMRLYEGKVLYVTYENREPIVLMMEDKNLFEMQRNIFSFLWDNAKLIE